MRRVFSRVVIMSALAVPAGAAEKQPAPQPRLVARIDGLIATQAGGNISIQARGAVDSGGWKAARLRLLKSGAGDAHTIVVEFVANPPPPGHAVIEGLLPVAANTVIRTRRGIVSVRVTSGSNEITTQILK